MKTVRAYGDDEVRRRLREQLAPCFNSGGEVYGARVLEGVAKTLRAYYGADIEYYCSVDLTLFFKIESIEWQPDSQPARANMITAGRMRTAVLDVLREVAGVADGAPSPWRVYLPPYGLQRDEETVYRVGGLSALVDYMTER